MHISNININSRPTCFVIYSNIKYSCEKNLNAKMSCFQELKECCLKVNKNAKLSKFLKAALFAGYPHLHKHFADHLQAIHYHGAFHPHLSTAKSRPLQPIFFINFLCFLVYNLQK